MLRTIWGDNERYLSTYWEKFQNRYYVAGDSAHRDKDGYFWIMGRIDDVLNVAGHRLGTMEIESALVSHPRVAEAAVVGRPHEVKGESVFAFVVCRGERPTGDVSKLVDELRKWVSQELGALARPGRHPLRRQPAEDALRQDHAPPAALGRPRRRNHPGRLHPRKPRHPRPAPRRRRRLHRETADARGKKAAKKAPEPRRYGAREKQGPLRSADQRGPPRSSAKTARNRRALREPQRASPRRPPARRKPARRTPAQRRPAKNAAARRRQQRKPAKKSTAQDSAKKHKSAARAAAPARGAKKAKRSTPAQRARASKKNPPSAARLPAGTPEKVTTAARATTENFTVISSSTRKAPPRRLNGVNPRSVCLRATRPCARTSFSCIS